MIFRIFYIFILGIIVFFFLLVLGLFLRIGKGARDLNRKIHEMGRQNNKERRNSRSGRSKDGVIELDKNQYKVE